jgi:predicted permease
VNFSDQPLFLSLTPVFLLIALGYVAGQRRWVREVSVPDLSNLVFLVLIPALLFRTMSTVRFETLDFRPVLAYFVAVRCFVIVHFCLTVIIKNLSFSLNANPSSRASLYFAPSF